MWDCNTFRWPFSAWYGSALDHVKLKDGKSHGTVEICPYWRETPERKAGTNKEIEKKDRENEVEDKKKK